MNIFEREYERVMDEVREVKERADLAFVYVTDSHISDNTDQTCENIRRMDEEIGFDCLVHTGDIISGTSPERVSRRLLKEEIALFRNSIQTKAMYIAKGNHDGWLDERYQGQLVYNITLKEKWLEDTGFMDNNPNLSRVGAEPYYYVDFPEKKIRLILLCSNWYEHDVQAKYFKNHSGFDAEELRWLGKEALVTEEDGWSILLFSHIAPLTEMQSIYPKKAIPQSPVSDRGGREAVALVRACKEGTQITVNGEVYDFSGRKTDVLCWCSGHIHGDMHIERETINLLTLASQTAYVCQLSDMPFGEYPSPREYGTISQDCWDSVFVCLEERKVYFFRFGAGKNRVISY